MNIQGLKQTLRAVHVPEERMQETVQRVAHWVNRVNEKGVYETIDPSEISSLRNLEELGILELKSNMQKIETVTVRLNAQGKELSKEFFRNAYFVKG